MQLAPGKWTCKNLCRRKPSESFLPVDDTVSDGGRAGGHGAATARARPLRARSSRLLPQSEPQAVGAPRPSPFALARNCRQNSTNLSETYKRAILVIGNVGRRRK
ncbi:hypothetical protein EVAR_26994_1 [Eumeta japonica]|uniref:Uncharacterized protein n=1 Tax=Eumeta variegata TaxID=151549 RepID=A0A4C1VJC6_EUMVA|nr:hypothetical protein EVAR_26994_1 [Eumeta japonica]